LTCRVSFIFRVELGLYSPVKEAEGKNKEKKPNPGKGHPRRKKHNLAIDLTKQCEVDPDDLDSTYEYKG
jgi:hypothetical protein